LIDLVAFGLLGVFLHSLKALQDDPFDPRTLYIMLMNMVAWFLFFLVFLWNMGLVEPLDPNSIMLCFITGFGMNGAKFFKEIFPKEYSFIEQEEEEEVSYDEY